MGRSAPSIKTSEASLEKWCKGRAMTVGAVLLKWVSPGQAGVSDRILIIPGGVVAFIEFKSPTKPRKPSIRQQQVLLSLEERGCNVEVIATRGQFMELLRELCDVDVLAAANRERIAARQQHELELRRRREEREAKARGAFTNRPETG